MSRARPIWRAAALSGLIILGVCLLAGAIIANTGPERSYLNAGSVD